MDVALHKLPVTIDRSGTCPDGASHSGMWDLRCWASCRDARRRTA
jgi:deoxyxylulose-5-phosphate synthase